MLLTGKLEATFREESYSVERRLGFQEAWGRTEQAGADVSSLAFIPHLSSPTPLAAGCVNSHWAVGTVEEGN